jgi:hypothetical protein
MNQTEEKKTNSSDMVAEAIAVAKKANELRGAAIEQLLAQREQIERDLQTLGYVPTATPSKNEAKAHVATPPPENSKRFKELTLAEVGHILLTENESLHGKEIERLAKAGGFKGGANNFQNYMPVAFKRAGTFMNIGGNTWKLKRDADG